jgi:hypothetical protein
MSVAWLRVVAAFAGWFLVPTDQPIFALPETRASRVCIQLQSEQERERERQRAIWTNRKRAEKREKDSTAF